MAYDRELRNMKRAANYDSGESHQLVALREHPSIDGCMVREIWGHGNEQEMCELAEKKAESHPDHDFIVEKE
jgi:hypothetical protein